MPLHQAAADVGGLDELKPSDSPSPRGFAYELKLTPREIEVLHLLAQGHSDKEIGGALFISHRTAMNHVARILAKLDVSSRASRLRGYAPRSCLAKQNATNVTVTAAPPRWWRS